jgi:hypothetical protein
MGILTGVTIYKFSQGIDLKRIDTQDGLSVLGDIILVIVSTLFSALIAAGIFPQLHGLVQQALVYGLATTAAVLVIALITTSILRAFCTRTSEKKIDLRISHAEMVERIKQEAQLPPPNDVAIQISAKCPDNLIFHNLYLGNTERLASSYAGNSAVRTIITTCPLSLMQKNHLEFRDQSETQIKNTLILQHGIEWTYVGGDFSDDDEKTRDLSKRWDSLVYECTYSHLRGINALADQPKTVYKYLPTIQWFEPIFSEIDSVLNDDQPLLIHGEEGTTAALLAAYLINRCGVTAQEALAFIQYNRPCITFDFKPQLEDYYNRLYPQAAADDSASTDNFSAEESS